MAADPENQYSGFILGAWKLGFKTIVQEKGISELSWIVTASLKWVSLSPEVYDFSPSISIRAHLGKQKLLWVFTEGIKCRNFSYHQDIRGQGVKRKQSGNPEISSSEKLRLGGGQNHPEGFTWVKLGLQETPSEIDREGRNIPACPLSNLLSRSVALIGWTQSAVPWHSSRETVSVA